MKFEIGNVVKIKESEVGNYLSVYEGKGLVVVEIDTKIFPDDPDCTVKLKGECSDGIWRTLYARPNDLEFLIVPPAVDQQEGIITREKGLKCPPLP